MKKKHFSEEIEHILEKKYGLIIISIIIFSQLFFINFLKDTVS